MLLDRETKTFFAVLTLVGSTFLMVNHLVTEAPVEDWLLAGVLFVISVTLWFWLWSEQQAATSTALAVADETDTLPQAKEWIISKEATTEVPALEVDKMIAEKAESVAKTPSEIIEAPPAQIMETPPAKIVAQPEPEPVAEAAEEEAPAPVAEEEAPPVAEEEAPAPVAEAEPEPAAAEDDEPDDLTRIEGVGPKYRDALIDAGVSTFDQLAAMSLEAIEKVATDAGMRRSASMDTWAEQAALAAKGEWEALDALQEELSGGRR